jgi:UDP:flavonoid glycosyltransferase YjiC (YdhE family)
MSPLRVLGLFPDWFGPKQSDWPPQTLLTRFPLYDEGENLPVPEGLERFLDEGAPPLVVTPGSANCHAREFFAAAVRACAGLGRRAVLLTRFPEQLPVPLPAGVRHFDYAPFSRVLPRAAALVHHGGIGTVAQGLAAGIPQLVMAMSHDQPDNGNRVRGLGVGEYLYPRAFTPDRVEAALQGLLASASVGEACRECRERIRSQMSAEEVVGLLEEVHPLAGR